MRQVRWRSSSPRWVCLREDESRIGDRDRISKERPGCGQQGADVKGYVRMLSAGR